MQVPSISPIMLQKQKKYTQVGKLEQEPWNSAPAPGQVCVSSHIPSGFVPCAALARGPGFVNAKVTLETLPRTAVTEPAAMGPPPMTREQ